MTLLWSEWWSFDEMLLLTFNLEDAIQQGVVDCVHSTSEHQIWQRGVVTLHCR